MNPSGTNDLVITIGGDLTDLQAAFDQIPQLAAQAFAGVQSALASLDFSNAGEGAAGASEAIGGLGVAAAGIGGDLANVGESASASDEAMSEAAEAADQLGESWIGLGADSADLGGDFSEIGNAAEGVDDGFSDLGDTLTDADDAMATAADSASTFADAMDGLSDAGDVNLSDVADGAADVASSLSDISDAASSTDDALSGIGESVDEASTGFASLDDAAGATDDAFSGIGDSLESADGAMTDAADAASTLASDMAALGGGSGSVDFSSVAEDVTALATALTDTSSETAAAVTGIEAVGEAAQGLGGDLADVSDQAGTIDSDLATLADSTAAAGAGFADIGDMVETSDAAMADAVEAAGDLASDWGDLGEAADASTDAIASVGDELSQTAEAAGEASESLAEVPEELESANEGAEEAEGSFSEMSESLETLATAVEGLAAFEVLKDVGSEAITAAANIQSATVSLQALGMSATQAGETIENLETLAVNDALSMPDLLLAEQRMTALQVPASQVTTLITDMAGAAATMNVNLTRVVQQVDNMVAAGNVSVSTLTRMGISAQSFVSAINQVAGQGTADVNDLTTAFQGLSQSQAIQVVEIAMQNLGASVTAQAATIKGQLQIIETQWDLVMEDIGGTIAPVTGVVVTGVNQILAAFRALPQPVEQSLIVIAAVTVGLGALAVAAAGATAAVGALAASGIGAAISGALGGIATFATDLTAMVTGLGEAAAGAAAFTLGLGALAVSIGGIVGWNLGKYVSGWIDDLDGASAAAKETAEATGEVSAAASAAAGPTGTLGSVLATLGVSQDQLAQKTKDSVTALQSLAQTALTVGEAAQNVVNAQKNATLAFSATAQAVAAGEAGLPQYTTALEALDKAQEAANNGLEASGTAALLAVNAFQQLQVSAANASTTFTAVASAYSVGQASLSQYTSALQAMVKAQEDANNGIESAGNAALLAANDYANIAVKATNAETTVAALAAAASAGAVSWTQYDTALKQMNADQEAANNGFQAADTAYRMITEDFQNMGVASTNSAQYLEQTAEAMVDGSASLSQYSAALKQAYQDELNLNSGVVSVHTQLLMAENDYTTLAQASTNAANKVAGYAQALAAGYPVLQQWANAVTSAATAATAAAGGIESFSSATSAAQAEQALLQQAVTNAQTNVTAIGNLYAQDAGYAGQYQKALQTLKTAQDALTGSQTAGAAAANANAAGITNMTTAMKGVGGAAQAATSSTSDFASTLNIINGQMVNLGTQSVFATDATENMAAGVSMVNGQMTNLGGTATTATSDVAGFANEMQIVNGAATTFGSSAAPAAAAGFSQIGQAAQNAMGDISEFSSDLSSLGSQLDKVLDGSTSLSNSLDAAFGDTGIGIGNLNVTTGANEQVTQPYAGTQLSTGNLGIQDPTELAGLPAGFLQSMNMGFTSTVDATTANATATTANTAATTANTTATTTSTTAITASSETAGALANQLTNVWNEYQDGQASLSTLTTATTEAAESIASQNTTLDAVLEQYQAGQASLGQLVSATIAAENSLNSVAAAGQDSANAINALNDGTVSASTSLAGMATAVASTSTALTTAADAVSSLPPMIAQVLSQATSTYAAASSYLGGSGVGGTLATPGMTNAATPVISTAGTAETESLNPAYSSNVSITVNAGTVVGSGGMQQLANMVGNQLVKNLGQSGIRITRQ